MVPCVESIRGILLKTEEVFSKVINSQQLLPYSFTRLLLLFGKYSTWVLGEPVTIYYWMDIHFRFKQCPLQSIHWPREHQRSFTRGEHMKIKRQLVELGLPFYYVGAKD